MPTQLKAFCHIWHCPSFTGDLSCPPKVGVPRPLWGGGPAPTAPHQHPDPSAPASAMSLPSKRPWLCQPGPTHPPLRYLWPDCEGQLLLQWPRRAVRPSARLPTNQRPDSACGKTTKSATSALLESFPITHPSIYSFILNCFMWSWLIGQPSQKKHQGLHWFPSTPFNSFGRNQASQETKSFECVLGFPGTYLEHLSREADRRHLKQMPKPPPLTPLMRKGCTIRSPWGIQLLALNSSSCP